MVVDGGPGRGRLACHHLDVREPRWWREGGAGARRRAVRRAELEDDGGAVDEEPEEGEAAQGDEVLPHALDVGGLTVTAGVAA